MADHEEQPGADRVTAASDETLRLYLLCRLAESERLNLDERLLVDDKLAERIVMVESELADDYAAGRLDSVEQEAFARRFLVTETRKQQLRFTQALQEFSRSTTPESAPLIIRPTGPSWRARVAALLSPSRPVWAIAGSFSILILLIGVAWFIARQRRDSTPLIARHESPTPAFSPAPPANLVPRVVISPTPPREPEAVATPAEHPVTIATFVLLPGAARSGGELKRVAVPGGKRDVVRFSLTLQEAAATGNYEIELATAEGQAVSLPNKLTASAGSRLVLDIPARLLHSGDYQIKLAQRNAAGQTEIVGRYYFRASKN
jgi:hypothetical protein